MKGSVYKRCQCRDGQGRRVKGCRKAHGSWGFTIDVGTNPTTGRRKQITRSRFRTKDAAEEAMAEEIATLNAGLWTDDRGMTVGAWLDQWLTELTELGRSPKTLANYRGHVRDVWRPHLGDVKLRDLRRVHIEKVLTELTRSMEGERPQGNVGRRVHQRALTTVDGYRRTIRAALSAAQRRGLISDNSAAGRMDSLTRQRNTTEFDDDDDDLVVWEPEETARFLHHVAHDRLAALYEIAAYAGLRRAELCGLRWIDLDPDWLGLRIRQTIVEVSRSQVRPGDLTCPVCGLEHIGRLFKRPKSKAGRRWIPLAGPAQKALAAHRQAQDTERDVIGDKYQDHGLVFCQPDGLPLRPGSVTTAFEAHTRACGLPIIRLHDTRHGACSLLLAGGVPIEVVQMILGHSSPTVTRRVYAHVMRKATADQVEKATELLTRHRDEQGRIKAGSPEVGNDGAAL